MIENITKYNCYKHPLAEFRRWMAVDEREEFNVTIGYDVCQNIFFEPMSPGNLVAMYNF